MMFDTTKKDLKDLLGEVHSGRLQLPDFQRDYVWGDEDVKSLLASIAKGFPVGALLMLETGGDVRFKPRVLEGVTPNDTLPQELLLDGQQRITSLYQSAYAKSPVRTLTPRDTVVSRFYYLDIKKSVENPNEMEDAIFGMPEDKVLRENFGKDIKLDLSNRELEFEHDAFPLNQVFDSRNWFYDWRDYWRERGRDVSDLDRQFVRGVVETIERYKMPIIKLDRDNSREAICLVFEKVNVGGKKLDAFELVTAIYAADSFDLREDWNGSAQSQGRRARLIGAPNPRNVLTQVASTDFLQACTLLHTKENRVAKAAQGFSGKDLPQVSCNRNALLALPLSAYKKHNDVVERGFIEAARFFNDLKIIWFKDIPYPALLIALASVYAILGEKACTAQASQRLAQWLWSITFGELYGSTTETRLARDVPELVEWIAGDGSIPRSLDEAVFQKDRLITLRSRLAAAYKGMHALLMRQGCRDFIKGTTVDVMSYFNDSMDIHHIFPKSWCKKQGIPAWRYDSIINKTPLSKRTNIIIGGNAPSDYLANIELKEQCSSEELDTILRSHLIEPELLRNNDFEAFFAARQKALADLISTAMGKKVFDVQGTNEPEEILAAEEENEE